MLAAGKKRSIVFCGLSPSSPSSCMRQPSRGDTGEEYFSGVNLT